MVGAGCTGKSSSAAASAKAITLPFYNSEFRLGEVVEAVDDAVDEAVGAGETVSEPGILRRAPPIVRHSEPLG